MWLMGKQLSFYLGSHYLYLLTSELLDLRTCTIWGLRGPSKGSLFFSSSPPLGDILMLVRGIFLIQKPRHQILGIENFHGNIPDLYTKWLVLMTSPYILVHLYNQNRWSMRKKVIMKLDADPVFPWLPRDAPHGMRGRRQVISSNLLVNMFLDLQVNTLTINARECSLWNALSKMSLKIDMKAGL